MQVILVKDIYRFNIYHNAYQNPYLNPMGLAGMEKRVWKHLQLWKHMELQLTPNSHNTVEEERQM